MAKRILKEKTRNSGTMTESAFFSFLRSKLRSASSRGWRPIQEARKLCRVPYVGENKRRKWSYVCPICSGEFQDKEMEVHHKTKVGSLKTFEDLPDFCRNLFVEIEGLICICHDCHAKITQEEK